MRPSVIYTDFIVSVKAWTRSKGTLFWTLAFPIIMILLFGSIFSGTGEVEYTIYVQDLDNTDMSAALIDIFNETGVLKVEMVKNNDIGNYTAYVQDNDISRLIVIPKDYEKIIQSSFAGATDNVELDYYFDPGDVQSNQLIRGIISNIIQSINMNITGGSKIIEIQDISTFKEDFEFIDFFIPGMIGFTIMQTCIYGSIERNTKLRKDGILRKLLTTPITRSEWILSKLLFMLFLSFISATTIILVGVFIWGVKININILAILILIATSFLFSGIGMLIGRFVKEQETADTAGGAISFPMMFLAGTFWPLEQLPEVMQIIARILPLYYVNEGLRNAMIYMNESDAIINAIAVFGFAAFFFIAGVLTTKWHED